MFILFALSTLLNALGSLAASSSVCTQAPYSQLLILSNFPAAMSLCSSKYPIKPCTLTVSTTQTVGVTTIATFTRDTTSVASATTLVTATVATATVYVTTATFTITSIAQTATSTINAGTSTSTSFTNTVTVTITSNPDLKPRPTRRGFTMNSSASKSMSSVLSSLNANLASTLSTVCYCIEAQPMCTTTTVGKTVTTSASTTVFVTRTIYFQSTVTQLATATSTIATDTTATLIAVTVTTITTMFQTTLLTDTTTTTTILPPTTSQSSPPLPPTDCTPGFQQGGGPNGCTYNVLCGNRRTIAASTQTITSTTPNGAQCRATCDSNTSCISYNYNRVSLACVQILFVTDGQLVADADSETGTRSSCPQGPGEE